MPVLIAAAAPDLDIVYALATLLRADGGEVRCYLEEDDHELRQIGCKIAVGDLDDAFRLDAALTNVHTFVPIFADIFTIIGNPPLFRGFAKAAAEALAASQIEQVILPISGLVPEANEVTSVVQDAVKMLSEAGVPACVIRTGLITGPDRPSASLRYRVGANVVPIDLLASVLKEADDREGTHGSWELGGAPEPDRPPEDQPFDNPNLQAWLDVLIDLPPLGNSAQQQFLGS